MSKQKLYIIRCGKTQLFKIGISNNPESRCKQLQTGNPENLKVYFQFEINNNKYSNIEASQIECTIHRFLKEYNKKHVLNEWFNLTDDEVVKIAECLIKIFN